MMFGHLQIYSGYSFQQSTILIEDLVMAAKEKHLDALALTDKNNMFATIEFSETCLKIILNLFWAWKPVS